MVKKIFTKIKVLIRNTYYKLFFRNIIIGKKLNYRKGVIFNCKKNAKLQIGNNVFFNNFCSINAHKYVSIGDNCIFGEGVKIYDHNHNFSRKDMIIRDQGYKNRSIFIGNNCWIGSNVIILAGSNIGENSIIGAGCIINSNIPKDCVVKNTSNFTCETRRE